MKLQELLKNKSSIVYRLFVCLTLFSFLFLCFMSFYNKYDAVSYVNDFLWIPILLIICINLLIGAYSHRKLYLFCFIFLIWIMLTYIFRGESPFAQDNLYVFLNRCLFCTIAIPFAHLMKDTKRHLYLNTFLIVTISLLAISLWLCFIGVLVGDNISLFNGKLEFGASYTITGRIKLKVMNLHYYHLGYLSLFCFFSSLYLAVKYWFKHLIPVWILLLATFGAGIIFTYSRGAIFTLVASLLLILAIRLKHLNFKRSHRIVILLVSTVVLAIVTVVGFNTLYKLVNSIRDIWHGLSTLSSRTTIWTSVLSVYERYPLAALYGLPLHNIMDIVNSLLPDLEWVNHMHSGYLQTLMSTGFPGLIAVVSFSVYVIKHCIRVFFAPSDSGISSSDKILTILPVASMVIGIFESIIFYNPVNIEIFNLITAVVSGYIIEMSIDIKTRKVSH